MLFSLREVAISMIDPLLAVTNQSVVDLSRALEAGWCPPRIPLFGEGRGSVSDLTVWTEVVMRDWVEGLELFDQYFPELTRRPDIWRIAVRSASHKCVMYLWKVMEYDKSGLAGSDLDACVTSVMLAMADPWSPSFAVKNILPLIDFFKQVGVTLDHVVPGAFEPGDFRPSGHSLFTRALMNRRWEVVQALWPDTSAPLPSWPRLDEVMMGVLDVVGGDYSPLSASVFHKVRLSLLPLPFKELSFTPCVFQELGVLDDRFLAAWLLDFGSQWPNTSMDAVERLALPCKSYIAPWFRVPLLFDDLLESNVETVPLELQPPYLRSVVWKIWARVFEVDTDRLWLRTLARDATDVEAARLLDLLKDEATDIWSKYWSDRGADGLSPADIWSAQMEGEA